VDSTHSRHADGIPIIDLAPWVTGSDRAGVASAIGHACREHGFFYVVGHGVDPDACRRLHDASARFFAADAASKMRIRMAKGGRAWRGYFPVGGELTRGRADAKEGLYFGAELGADHPDVVAGKPMHGANLFPDLDGFRSAVLDHIAAMTDLGHRLMEVIGVSLGLAPDYFAQRYTGDPLVLFRIFHYPPLTPGTDDWSVAEHTDYGVLTILLQDDVGGLQVKTRDGWVDAPPIEDSFVCNLGDMLDRMSGGLYRSTPHRVSNTSGGERLSLPFFFDPGWDVEVEPLVPGNSVRDDPASRWDGRSPDVFEGTYGEYLLSKVGKVFPDLKEAPRVEE